MFTFEQFDYLHSIWDGKAENVGPVCGSCGVCCNKPEVGYFPGEAEYLSHKLGYPIGSNYSLADGRCTCNVLNVKTVICKVFPMTVKTDLRGWELIEGLSDAYSNNCHKLKFDAEKIHKFLNYLFSDVENRVYWFMSFNADYEADLIKEAFAAHGFRLNKYDAELRAIYKLNFLNFGELDGIYEYKSAKNTYDRALNGTLILPKQEKTPSSATSILRPGGEANY